MNFIPVSKHEQPRKKGSQSGIALMLVMASVGMLAMLVSEFTYVAQVNQRMAYGGLDQLKAHYLAKSAFKLSLLRLKAYIKVKEFIGQAKKNFGAAAPKIPMSVIDQIWATPFIYPIPTELPGLTPGAKGRIKKFQDESGFEGSFSSLIESESSKYNLNLLLQRFVPVDDKPPENNNKYVADSQGKIIDREQNLVDKDGFYVDKAGKHLTDADTPVKGGSPKDGKPATEIGKFKTPDPNEPDKKDEFKPEEARKNLATFLNSIFQQKIKDDEDFGDEYRDLKIDELVSNIAAWADRKYESPFYSADHPIKPKKAPFYALDELHMIPLMDDQLYDLFTPQLTVSPTPGININQIKKASFVALFPTLTEEEVKKFFEYRDDPKEDHRFETPDAFFKFLTENTGAFASKKDALEDLKKEFRARNIRIVTEETLFKVTVQALVNQATVTLEAMITLGTKPDTPPPPPPPPPDGAPPPEPATKKPDSGLKISFMRFL